MGRRERGRPRPRAGPGARLIRVSFAHEEPRFAPRPIRKRLTVAARSAGRSRAARRGARCRGRGAGGEAGRRGQVDESRHRLRAERAESRSTSTRVSSACRSSRKQDAGINLSTGTGFYGIYPAQNATTGSINHVCFGMENFDADAVLKQLTDRGIKGNIRLRGDTKELYFTDPDGIRVQLAGREIHRRNRRIGR